ncbi:MAG: inositol monophosphatase [Candidatus Doudnabacteria bacterium]|nr:inositol monophosphatase [Candidatus Doudnabacteria bacterium]
MDQFIQKLAKAGGKIALSKFRKIKSFKTKTHRKDLLTAADLAANNFIINKIKARFPSHGIVTEEKFSKDKIGKGYTWIVDPLDGTNAFAHGIPFFCTAIALLMDKEVILAAVYDPNHDELFFAKKNSGAYLNGKKIKPVVRNKLWQTSGSFLFTYELPFRKRRELSLRAHRAFFDHEIALVRPPAIILNECYVAAGRLDLMFWRNFYIWDTAPGYLIMKEAGVKVTNFQGQPWSIKDKGFIAARPVIYKQLYPILKKNRIT